MGPVPVGSVLVDRPAWVELPLGDHVLAECPRWDAPRERLSWVDIKGGTVCWAPYSAGAWGEVRRLAVGRVPTAAEPLLETGGWAVAVDGTLRTLSDDGELGAPVPVSADFPDVRTNDMTRVPGGPFVVGLFTEDGTSPRGGLVAVDLGSGVVTTLAEGLVTANGLAVTPDRTTLYAVDTGRGTLSRHSMVADGGQRPEPQVVVRHEGPGVLDGILLGPDGDVWVAVWGAGEVRRHRPDGSLRSVWSTPVPRPSALAVVPLDGVAHLVVTTARTELRDGPPVATHAEGRLYATPAPDLQDVLDG